MINRKLFVLLSFLVLASLLLAACGSQTSSTSPTAATQPPAAEKTVVIGFTTSLTGKLNVESTRQNNGFQLWMDQVNAAGGIKLKDGTLVKVSSKFYDDESNKDRVQELYTRLVTEEKADFLVPRRKSKGPQPRRMAGLRSRWESLYQYQYPRGTPPGRRTGTFRSIRVIGAHCAGHSHGLNCQGLDLRVHDNILRVGIHVKLLPPGITDQGDVPLFCQLD